MERWQVFMDGRWVDFADDESDYIMDTYKAGKKVCHVQNSGKNYVIDFRTTSLTSQRSGRRRPIRLACDNIDSGPRPNKGDDDCEGELTPLSLAARNAKSNVRANAKANSYEVMRRCKKWVGNDDDASQASASQRAIDGDWQDERRGYRRRDERYQRPPRVREEEEYIEESDEEIDDEFDSEYEEELRREDRGSRDGYGRRCGRFRRSRDSHDMYEDDGRPGDFRHPRDYRDLREEERSYDYRDPRDYRGEKVRRRPRRSREYSDDSQDESDAEGRAYDDEYYNPRRPQRGSQEESFRCAPTPCVPLGAQPRGQRMVRHASPTKIYDDGATRTVFRSRPQTYDGQSDSGSYATPCAPSSRGSEDYRGTRDSHLLEVPRTSDIAQRKRAGSSRVSVDALENAPTMVNEVARSPRGSSASTSPRVARITDVPISVTMADDARKVSNSMMQSGKSMRSGKLMEPRDTSSTAVPGDGCDTFSNPDAGVDGRDGRYISQASSISSRGSGHSYLARRSADYREERAASRHRKSDDVSKRQTDPGKTLLLRVTADNGMVFLVSTTTKTTVHNFALELESQHQLSNFSILCDGAIVQDNDEIGQISSGRLTVRQRS